MLAVTLLFSSLCVFCIAYRTYGLFIANKVLNLRNERATPAVKYADRHDYLETNRYVLFGHHFSAIASAGPLIGPVLAAQFGYLPGTLWILIGCVLAGGVHDMVVLFASVRHRGQSLAYIATQEIGETAGVVSSLAIVAILLLTLAGLSIAVVNLLFHSPWGAFTVATTIPIAILMGLYLQVWRPGDVRGATSIGVSLLFLVLLAGPYLADYPSIAKYFDWDRNSVSILIPVYGFFASVLPVWLLLLPRDYLSTYLKVGTIAALAVGIVIVRPDMLMPMLTRFVDGGGPVVNGPVIPFICITIACGAISGFHSIIGTGTTPKMIGKERDVLFVGYGAMLVEGAVAIMALIAACVLVPGDYFAIMTPHDVYVGMKDAYPDLMHIKDLPLLEAGIGESLADRPGGAVTLAVGMAFIFSQLPGMDTLMGFWYHFAIMFQAVFILSAIDAGTRVGRLLLQEMLGRLSPRLGDKNWWPGIILTSLLYTGSWGYLVYTGDVSTIWPLFGVSNQLLASVSLLIGTTLLLRLDKARYAWITAIPGLMMISVTLWANVQLLMGVYVPQKLYLLSFLSIVIMGMTAFVVVGTLRRWVWLLRQPSLIRDEYGDMVKVEVPE